MTYHEDDLLPLSALQHLAFCERQCALIHIEQVWLENRLTAEGRLLHDKTHEGEGEVEVRGDCRIARALRLRSLELGLSGQADMVEFHKADSSLQHSALSSRPSVLSPQSSALSSQPPASGLQAGLWQPFPVEYKRGKQKPGHCDQAQLCAQALCLEEMLGVAIPRGALFYGKTRRRLAVEFTPALRAETADLAARLHALFEAGRTPPAVYEKKCESCSLLPVCKPRVTGGDRSARRYVARTIREIVGPTGADPDETDIDGRVKKGVDTLKREL